MACGILEILFVLINVNVCIGTNGMAKRGLVNPAFEDISEVTHVIGEMDSDGVINCMMLCSNNDDCRSVSFNKLDNRCRLFSRDCIRQTPTGPSEIGWIHYDFVQTAPRDCSEIQSQGHTTSGLYTLTIGGNQVPVWCDLETEGGGWTVFQRRSDGSVDFDRDWNDYVRGFGDPTREYWIGNDALSDLTSSGQNELLIRMETWDGVWKHARYSKFRVNDGTDKYRLHFGSYSGTAGDSLRRSYGQQFSTRDQDNDAWGGSCNPYENSGGWWIEACTDSLLNGIYYTSDYRANDACFWGYRVSLHTVFMMVR